MSIFVLADTHLSQELDKPMDVFGKRWAGYTEKLIDGWTAAVKEDDTVIVPGDVCWGMTIQDALPSLRLIHTLPGKKILGKGNHEFWWTSLKKMNEQVHAEGLTSLSFLYNNAFLCENKLIVGTRGWFYDQKTSPRDTDFDKIVNREAGRLRLSIEAAQKIEGADKADEMLCFLHFPAVFKDQICQPIIDVIKENGIRRCYYGHIHGVYDIEPEIIYENITFRMISADYLSFIPHKIL